MKKYLIMLFTAVWLFPSSSQAQMFAEVECNASNIWSNVFLGMPARLINAFVLHSDGSGAVPLTLFSITSSSIEQNGEDVPMYDSYSYWAVINKGDDDDEPDIKDKGTASPLFRDFGYSLKVGWQPAELQVGFYVIGGWRHEAFKLQLDGMKNPFRYHTDCVRVCMGLRISPLRNLLSKIKVAPVFEVASTYDHYLSWGRLPFGNDLDQLNNGISHHLGAGLRFNNSRGTGFTFMVSCDTKKYNQFNQDFTYEGKTPYEGVTTSNHLWTVNFTMDY
jgi:hypothetical protein